MSASSLARRRTRHVVTISRDAPPGRRRRAGPPTGDRPARRSTRKGAGMSTVEYATGCIAGRLRRLRGEDAGMSTVEYAIGCIAAAAFAAVLYAVVSGDSVVAALTQLVQRALTAGF